MAKKINRKKLMSLLLVLVGNTIFATAVKLFLLPANLISCGTTGLALLVEHYAHISIPVFTLIFNLIMLGIGWKILGTQFALTTVFSSLYFPAVLETLDRLLGNYQITTEPLLNVLFAGIFMATGLGMVIRGGASTGGMDVPPLILQKLFRIPVSSTLWAFDFCIMLAQMSFHPMEDLLYGMLLTITVSITLNKVTLFGTTKTEVKIVTQYPEEMRDKILSQVERGVTLLHGESGYLHQNTEVLLTVISNREVVKIERLAREVDPACFMIINQVSEVWGRGFSYAKDDPEIKD